MLTVYSSKTGLNKAAFGLEAHADRTEDHWQRNRAHIDGSILLWQVQ